MNEDELERRNIFIATTSMVILFTVFVQGGLTYTTLQWLNIDIGVDENRIKVMDDLFAQECD